MKKIYLIGILFLVITAQGHAQTDTVAGFEIRNHLPLFYDQAVSRLKFPLAWRNWHAANPGKSFQEWRETAREKVFECMLTPPSPSKPNMKIVAEEKRDGYRAYLIEHNLSAFSRVRSYLLVPDGADLKKGSVSKKFPAVVMLHDHGAKFDIGKEKMVKPIQGKDRTHYATVLRSATDWVNKNYDSTFVADYYAEHGYVVFVTDALFWGERGIKQTVSDSVALTKSYRDEIYREQQALAANMEQMGMCWSAMITYDDISSAEFVAGLPFVDTSKIFSLGFSMGAYRAWMLAALSDRVSAAAAVCWMGTTRSMMSPTNNQAKGYSAFSMTIPGLRNWMDFADVASIICPKTLLIYNGRTDKLFPAPDVAQAYSILRKVWTDQKFPDNRLITKTWPGGHQFTRPMQDEILRTLGRISEK